MEGRLELRGVDRNSGTAEQRRSAAEQDELPAHAIDVRAVVTPEVGNRFMIRRQPAGQRHQLDIACRLALLTAMGD
jgi:hypothetical protein